MNEQLSNPILTPRDRLTRRLDQLLAALKPGSRLPTDRELSKTFSISERTVRSVLNTYRDKGRVVRIRGKGTFTPFQEEHPDRSSCREKMTTARELAQELLDLISGGKHRNRSPLPSIKYLCLEYGVSRRTATSAMRIVQSLLPVAKVGRTYFLGGRPQGANPGSAGDISIFMLDHSDFEAAYAFYRMGSIYASMERELIRCGYRVRYFAEPDLDRQAALFRRQRIMPPVVLVSLDLNQSMLASRIDGLQRLKSSFGRRKGGLLLISTVKQKLSNHIEQMCTGHLATSLARNAAQFLFYSGFKRACLFFDQHTSHIFSFPGYYKIAVEWEHIDTHCTFRSVIQAKPNESGLENYLAGTMPAFLGLASKYSGKNAEDLRSSIIFTTSLMNKFSEFADFDVWIFAQDIHAISACQWAAERGISIPRDLSIIALQNSPGNLYHGITVCQNDNETTGYALAHAVIGDIPVAQTRRGFVSTFSMVHARSTT